MKKAEATDALYTKRRKLFSGISILIFIAVTILFTLLFSKVFAQHIESSETLLAFLESFGWKGRFILFGLQCLQIIVALIPGEIIELGAGYAYGAIEGTLLCLAGIALSTSIVFLLVKRIGTPMVETFISRERIKELRFINTERKLNRIVFLLFFIPGTPKDMLTYFVGLTDMKLSTFLPITLIARIPSVVSSTICGQYLGRENYLTALIVYGITATVSLSGYFLYTKIVKRHRNDWPK